MSTHGSGTVVIVGASIAGLAAARVFSERAQRVLVLDPDEQGADLDAPRKGVPQGRQAHILLKSGELILERLFPGITAELMAEGSHELELTRDVAWFHAKAWKPRCDGDVYAHFQRRVILEKVVRRRTLALENVSLRESARVTGLVFEQGRVGGVKLADEVIHADMVVDASGRGSQAAKWIAEAGFSKPRVDAVGSDVTYASALVRLAEPLTEFKALALYPALPVPGWGVLFPVDRDQYMVTLMGNFDDVPGSDRASMIEFAARLGQPHLHALIQDAEFVTDITRFHFKGSRYIRYDKASRLPRGFLALGDAVCSFNPVFGQGMSTALIAAEVLEQMLQGSTLDIDPRAYFRRVAKTLAFPWRTGVTEDFRSPQTTGSKPLGLRLNQKLTDVMNAYSSANESFYRNFVNVVHMIRPPSAVLNPRSLAAMLLSPRKPLSQGPRVRVIKSTSEQPAPAASASASVD